MLKPGTSYPSFPQRQEIYVHRKVEDLWSIEGAEQIEPRHSETIRNLLLQDLDGQLDSSVKHAQWMRVQLATIGAVFRAGERAKNVTLGAQWLFDSYCGNDELLQFVQAAVVVEILLGDKAFSDLMGLGELLANRCAYLIASTHSERTEVLRDFRSIYEVRSKIVHSGKSRLAGNERMLFNKLRWMCRRVIQEEADLIAKDTDTRPV